MWNPVHFAVFFEHLNIVTFLLSEFKVNPTLTCPRANAESETDPTNSVNFPEDKILVLLLAVEKRNGGILSFLLNNCGFLWPTTTINTLLA